MKCLKCKLELPKNGICTKCGEIIFADVASYGKSGQADQKMDQPAEVYLTNETVKVMPKSPSYGAVGGLIGGIVTGLIENSISRSTIRSDLFTTLAEVTLQKNSKKKTAFYIPHDTIMITCQSGDRFALRMLPERASALSLLLQSAVQRNRTQNSSDTLSEAAETNEPEPEAPPKKLQCNSPLPDMPIRRKALQCPKRKLMFGSEKPSCPICRCELVEKP